MLTRHLSSLTTDLKLFQTNRERGEPKDFNNLVCTAVNDNSGGKYLLLIVVVFFKILAIEALTSPALLPACFVSYFTFFLFYKWLYHHILNKRISKFYL